MFIMLCVRFLHIVAMFFCMDLFIAFPRYYHIYG